MIDSIDKLMRDEVEFLIWDDYFEDKMDLLCKAREEAASLYATNQMKEAGFGKQL